MQHDICWMRDGGSPGSADGNASSVPSQSPSDDDAVLDLTGDPVHGDVLDLTGEEQAPTGSVRGVPADEVNPLVAVLSLAADHGWPCVPVRPGLTILGTPWAWRRFVDTAAVQDRAAARAYLDELPYWED